VPHVERLEERAMPSVTIDSLKVPTHAKEFDSVLMSAEATDAEAQPLTYSWDFDDGTTQSGTDLHTVSHAYAKPGIYVVRLEVSDAESNEVVAYDAITIQDDGALIVYVTPDELTGKVNDPIAFAGSYSDPNGSVSASGIAWDFHYNGLTFNSMVTGTLTPSYTYNVAGVFDFALQITDEHGLREIAVGKALVRSYEGPTVTADSDLEITEGTSVTFAGSFTDPDGTVATQDIVWDFNQFDEHFGDVWGVLNPTWLFNTPGDYGVTFQVTDNHGMSDVWKLLVKVKHAPPWVESGTGYEAYVGDLVSLEGFYEMPASVDPLDIEWDFDYDGQDFTVDMAGTLSPEWSYSTTGTYTVALRVTDANNLTVLDGTEMLIGPARPGVTVNEQVTVTQGQFAQFNAVVITPEPYEIDWDFGDHDEGVFNPDSGAHNVLNPTHQYMKAGRYLVTVRVTNQSGGVRERTIPVTVVSVPPTATPSDSAPTPEATQVFIYLENLTDVNPDVEFEFHADWWGAVLNLNRNRWACCSRRKLQRESESRGRRGGEHLVDFPPTAPADGRSRESPSPWESTDGSDHWCSRWCRADTDSPDQQSITACPGAFQDGGNARIPCRCRR
jgi:PKD repeat protein